ncbi:hypothetical protein [Corynebacterium mustelae]|uniref:hypothetical protein n=1 Tax=Corynebacterium mustelae TaxID=571915 RepID=UPI000A9CA6D6|nr:hypothetical protein [Corynebacterium mustelae]
MISLIALDDYGVVLVALNHKSALRWNYQITYPSLFLGNDPAITGEPSGRTGTYEVPQ